MTTSTYRNLLFAWLEKHRPASSSTAPERRALEVGCGYGYVTEMLAEQGYDAIGTDISAHAIELAERESAHERAPLRGLGRDDAVALRAALRPHRRARDHRAPRADPEAALARWSGLLAPGGSLICTTPNRHGPASRFWRDADARERAQRRAVAPRRSARPPTGTSVDVDAVQCVPGLWRLQQRDAVLPAAQGRRAAADPGDGEDGARRERPGRARRCARASSGAGSPRSWSSSTSSSSGRCCGAARRQLLDLSSYPVAPHPAFASRVELRVPPGIDQPRAAVRRAVLAVPPRALRRRSQLLPVLVVAPLALRRLRAAARRAGRSRSARRRCCSRSTRSSTSAWRTGSGTSSRATPSCR